MNLLPLLSTLFVTMFKNLISLMSFCDSISKKKRCKYFVYHEMQVKVLAEADKSKLKLKVSLEFKNVRILFDFGVSAFYIQL